MHNFFTFILKDYFPGGLSGSPIINENNKKINEIAEKLTQFLEQPVKEIEAPKAPEKKDFEFISDKVELEL